MHDNNHDNDNSSDNSSQQFTTRWWWVRHAPVSINNGRIYGQQDLSCDCSDKALFDYAAKILPRPAKLITSDLCRTVETAEAIRQAGYHDLPPPLIDADLREQNLGHWQGKTREEIGIHQRALSERFWLTPEFEAAPGGESFADLCARTAKRTIHHSWQYRNQDIICVAHNGTIRAALVLALNCAPATVMRFVIDNVSITRLDFIRDGIHSYWRVCTINDLPQSRGWKNNITHVSG